MIKRKRLRKSRRERWKVGGGSGRKREEGGSAVEEEKVKEEPELSVELD
jgi:hypothetical protein